VPVNLVGDVWLLSHELLTHPWDASGYFIPGDEPTLIDCGSAEGYEAMKRDLAGLGYKPGDIRRVFGTHGHWDHLSAMAQLREETDAELLLHAADREQVEQGDPELTASFLYERPFPPIRVDAPLEEGQSFDVNGVRLSVLHTPGHTPGSVSFIAETGGHRLLIAGDTMWGGASRYIRSDLDQWVVSLDRLLEEDFDVMTAGHIPPRLVTDAKRRVRESRRYFGIYFDPWFRMFYDK
jgi:glyoxylase-like metal-dependent hydrolase (beta-lactamase superfamily II)